MCTKDKRSTYIPIIPQKDSIQWQGQATHGLLHDSVEEMSERWVLRNSRSFTFYGNPTPTSHGNPWCDAIPCSPHLMGPDLELEPLGCPGPSRQVLPAKWCQWFHATKGMGIFITFIPMECWKPSRLPASVALVLFLDQNTPSSIAEMGTSTAKRRKEFAVHLASKTGKNKHQTKLSVSLQEWTEQLTRSISFTQMYLQYYILS